MFECQKETILFFYPKNSNCEVKSGAKIKNEVINQIRKSIKDESVKLLGIHI